MRISNQWKTQSVDELLEAMLKLKSKKEAQKFFRDLLTQAELLKFANRWRVARMLTQGKPYSEIEKKTGMSSAIISRINKWIQEGMGGYRLMLKRLNIRPQEHHHVSQSIFEGDS